MKKLLRFLLFCLFFAWFGKDGKAQAVAPDCTIPFSFTAASQRTSPSFQNFSSSSPVGCVVWVIGYRNQGFSALSLQVDSAADTTSSGVHVPSTWGAFSGAILDGNAASATTGPGINPNTDTNWGFTMLKGAPAWVSVTLVSVTGSGSISGTLLGWRPHGVDQTTAAAAPPGGTCPGGSVDGEVQYKDGADCGGNVGFVFLKATGMVGIGTATPVSPLDIRSANITTSPNVSGNANIMSTDSQAANIGGRLTFGGNTHLATNPIVYAAVEGLKTNSTDNNSAGYLSFRTNDGSGDLFEAMRVQSDGSVLVDLVAFIGLGTPANGSQRTCSDCTVTSAIDNTCASGGSGAQAFRVNGAWKCVI